METDGRRKEKGVALKKKKRQKLGLEIQNFIQVRA